MILDQGWYAYIESSAPRTKGDRARLVSPQITDNQQRCLTFWLVLIIEQFAHVIKDVMLSTFLGIVNRGSIKIAWDTEYAYSQLNDFSSNRKKT